MHGGPFFAVNCHLRQENNFAGNLVMETGWAWRAQGDHLARLGLQYFNGYSEQYQFYKDTKTRLASEFGTISSGGRTSSSGDRAPSTAVATTAIAIARPPCQPDSSIAEGQGEANLANQPFLPFDLVLARTQGSSWAELAPDNLDDELM